MPSRWAAASSEGAPLRPAAEAASERACRSASIWLPVLTEKEATAASRPFRSASDIVTAGSPRPLPLPPRPGQHRYGSM